MADDTPTLREYLERALAEQNRAFAAALENNARALTVALASHSNEHRLTQVALEKAADALAERAETIVTRITALERGMSELQGRMWALGAGLGLFVALLSIAVSVALRLVR